MDFAAFALEAVADLAVPETPPHPTFPTSAKGCGNEIIVKHQEFTHTSHISHHAEVGLEIEPTNGPQAGARAGAGACDGDLSKSVGNVGTVGNTRRIKGLHFPQPLSEVGKKRESGKSEEASALPAPAPNASGFDERAAFLEFECGLPRDQAEAITRAEVDAARTTTPTDGLSATDGLALWRARLARLNPHVAPCPDYRFGEWPAVYAQALLFLDRFGAQAEALGWTAARLFGVHPDVGTTRVDHCGALVLGVGGPARAITATEIRLGHLTYRTKPGQPEGVPIWSFRR